MASDNKDYTRLTDEILFNCYVGGDVRAFEVLLGRVKGLVYSLILRYVRDSAGADEIFQEVFLKVCKNKDQFRQAISFKSWLVAITKNTCIDHNRKRKRSLKTESFDCGQAKDARQPAETIAAGEPGPDESLTVHMETEELEGLLDRLPLKQRETFYLKVVVGLTFEEIGQAMQVSTNTAKSRYRYALNTLRGLVRRKRVLERGRAAV